MRVRIALVLVVLACPMICSAQSLTADFEALAEERGDDELSSILKGQTTLDAAGAPATERDYLTFFTSALESLSASKGESITFDWNFPLLKLTNRNDVIKTQIVLRKPALATALTTALSPNLAAIDALKGELSFDDDVALTISYAPTAAEARAKLKSRLKSFASSLGADLIASRAVAAELAAGTPDASTANMAAALATVGAQRVFMEVIEPYAEALAVAETSQDNWTFDIYARARQEYAGPNELKIKARYEHPFGKTVSRNLADRSKCQNTSVSDYLETCVMAKIVVAAVPANADDAAVATAVAAAVAADANADKAAVAAAVRRAAAARRDAVAAAARVAAFAETAVFLRDATQKATTNRFVAEVDLQWVTANNIALPQYLTAPVPGKSSRSVSASASYGRDVFRPLSTIDRRGRLDAELKYDDVTGDDKRRDRFVASVTYTQKLSEKVQIPVSLAYANHADYLTNVDRKLNAHFGLSWKLPGM